MTASALDARRKLAHELRGPLSAILGFASLLHSDKAGPLNDKQREFAGDVITCARELESVIERALGDSAIGPE